MPQRILAYALVICALLGSLDAGLSYAATAEKPRAANKLLTQFDRFIQGEFDNYNQVNFDRNDFLHSEDKPAKPHARLYKRIVRLNQPQLGEYVYYEQTHNGDRFAPVYRQVLMVLTADHARQQLVSHNYKFDQADTFENLWLRPDLTIEMSQLKALGKNCETRYTPVAGGFIGEVEKSRCKVASKHGGEVSIASFSSLSSDSYWSIESGYRNGKKVFGSEKNDSLKLIRAHRFSCWAAFKTAQRNTDGSSQWDFFDGLSLHNQGDIALFTTSDTPAKEYFIRLKETRFPAGNRPNVLEIFVHHNTEAAKTNYQRALGYSWTDSDANRVGINLDWMQASCSRVQ